MANNRIPRNAKKIYITWLIDTSTTRTGDRDTVERIDNKWIGTSATGATYSMPVSILRNANVVQVDQIETDEPNNRKNVLLSNAGVQVYIVDGKARTDKAALAVISALCESGRITEELAERARNDRPTLDKIKKNMIHAQMETRETETGKRWTFYTASGVFMDIPAYSRNYITADADGNLYAVEAPTETEITEGKEEPTPTDTEPQRATETAQKTADDTTTAGSDTDLTEAAQTKEKTTDMETFKKEYSRIYRHLYDHEGHAGVDATRRKYSRLFDESWEQIKDVVKAFYTITGDLLTSDRECAAFMKALETVGTPTATDTRPQEATQPAAVIPMENDTTSDTKTAESATATTGGEGTQEAAQDAQNAHRATKAHRPIQGHTTPHKRPYRATQRAARSIMRHAPTTATGRRTAEKSHFLAGMGSAKILDQGNHPPPILAHFFDRFLKRFLSGQKSAGGTGV